MSEHDAPARKLISPAEVWGELDANTQERVIDMFIDMAFRLVANQAEDSKEPGMSVSEKPTERSLIENPEFE
jgi:hypothetical protein